MSTIGDELSLLENNNVESVETPAILNASFQSDETYKLLEPTA